MTTEAAVLPGLAARSHVRPKLGATIAWRHRYLGLCVGRVVGVYPTGVTARRDGIADQTKPHYLAYGEFWFPPVRCTRTEAAT